MLTNISNQQTQERLQASRVAETQFERLKLVTTNTPQAFSWSSFCLDSNDTKQSANDPSCSTGSGITYRINVVNAGTLTTPGHANAGTNFKVTVSWDALGSKTATSGLDFFYGVYK